MAKISQSLVFKINLKFDEKNWYIFFLEKTDVGILFCYNFYDIYVYN